MGGLQKWDKVGNAWVILSVRGDKIDKTARAMDSELNTIRFLESEKTLKGGGFIKLSHDK